MMCNKALAIDNIFYELKKLMNKLENNKAKCSGSGLQSQHLGD
jgi:hypothetical protein